MGGGRGGEGRVGFCGYLVTVGGCGRGGGLELYRGSTRLSYNRVDRLKKHQFP